MLLHPGGGWWDGQLPGSGLFRFRSWLPYSVDVLKHGKEGFWTKLIVKERFVIGKVRPCLQRDEKFDSSQLLDNRNSIIVFCSWSQPVAARDGPSPGAATLGQAGGIKERPTRYGTLRR